MVVNNQKLSIHEIPSDWEILTIDGNFDFLQNNTYSRSFLNSSTGSVNNIHYGDVLIKYGPLLNCDEENIPFVNPDVTVETRNRLIQDGDAIIADTAEDNTVGKATEIINVGDRKIVSGLHTILIRPKPNLFSKKFLGYYLNSSAFHDQLLPYIVGTKVSSISRSSLREVFVICPPKKEQEAIVSTLLDIDGYIAALEKLIVKKQNIKKGTMHELLTGKSRLPGFQCEWVERSLGEVALDIRTGNRNNEEKVDHGKYPFYVRSQQVERINDYSFDCEAILIPGEGNIGEIFHYVNGKFDCHQRVYKISEFKGVNAKFLYYYMSMFFGKHALTHTVKATVDSLRLPTFLDFKLKTPIDEAEQTAISEVLNNLDEELFKLKTLLNKTKLIKHGVMQELLTGHIRLATDSENMITTDSERVF